VDPALTVRDRLAAYPPGAPLPVDLAADLREILGRARFLSSADDDEIIRRRQCLAVLLTLGDNTGDRLRSRAWARDEQSGWSIADDVGELSRRIGLPPEIADDYMGLDGHFGPLAEAGEIELTLGWDDAASHRAARVVTFAAMAAAAERCR